MKMPWFGDRTVTNDNLKQQDVLKYIYVGRQLVVSTLIKYNRNITTTMARILNCAR